MIKFSEILKRFKSKPVQEPQKTDKIEKRGGKREGAGPPFKYGEQTVNITLRVPVSKKHIIKKIVYTYLNQFLITKDDESKKFENFKDGL